MVLIYGIHAVRECLLNSSKTLHKIYIVDKISNTQRLLEIKQLADKQRIPLEYIARDHLENMISNGMPSSVNDTKNSLHGDDYRWSKRRLSRHANSPNKQAPVNHQGVIAFGEATNAITPSALCRHQEPLAQTTLSLALPTVDNTTAISHNLEDCLANITSRGVLDEVAKHRSIILMLDGVTDPQNLGAIIRSAEFFGADLLILPKHGSANPHNPAVAKTSSGAIYNLPIVIVNNLLSAIDTLKDHDYWIAGASCEKTAVNLTNFKPDKRLVWVLGSEGNGLRRHTKQNCDYLVTIGGFGKTQSLNVSVTAGILLAHTTQN